MPLLSRTRSAATLALFLAAQVLCTASLPGSAWAQPRPAPRAPELPRDLIARGQFLFEEQQYEESIQTLSAALLRPSNTKQQKIDVYRLLALNFITLGRKDEAESAVRGLLVIEPEYQLPASESPRFRDFFATVRTKWEAEGRPGIVKEEAPPPKPVFMRHTSPSQMDRGKQIDLVAHLDDPDRRVDRVELFFRSGTRGPFEKTLAQMDPDLTVRATVPPAAVKPPIVEYYLTGYDKGGLPLVSRGDTTAPLRVAVPEPRRSGWVLPVAIGGGIVGAAAIVIGSMAIAGVFKSTPVPAPPPGQATVTIIVRDE